jgi:hypothetical protein
LLACGKTTGDAEQFLTDYKAAYCEGIRRCCGTYELRYSASACAASFPVPEIGEMPLKYDADAARSCLDAIKAAGDLCGRGLPDDAAVTACQSALHGSVPREGHCQVARDCAPLPVGQATRCSTDTRVCQAIVYHAQEGDDCGSGTMLCMPDLYCTGGKCARRGAIGDACPTPPMSDTCESGASCEDGSCVARGDGATCGLDRECGHGFGCNIASCTCEPLKREGEGCVSNAQCGLRRCADGKCHSAITVLTCTGGPASVTTAKVGEMFPECPPPP